MTISVIQDWQYVVLVGVIVILFGLLQWSAFRHKAYQFMLYAKIQAKYEILKSGQEQEDRVVAMLQMVPYFILVPEAAKRVAVKQLYKLAKDIADDGNLNNSNIS
jgi:hypothetical protein